MADDAREKSTLVACATSIMQEKRVYHDALEMHVPGNPPGNRGLPENAETHHCGALHQKRQSSADASEGSQSIRN